MRTADHHYCDPVDQIWLETARLIGLRVDRSDDAYATTDGDGKLVIGPPHTLDADDCLAQMILHELCHSLVEGPEAFTRPDWGLDNTGPRDVAREHACLRLQAVLAGEYGLARVLAPTTEFRGFYDQLGRDPLGHRRDPSVAAAILGLHRADTPPWSPHLRAALAATGDIARIAARFAPPERAPGPPSLWQLARAACERHPTGHALLSPGPSESDTGRSCGTCVWRYRAGPGKIVDRCRQAGGQRIAAEWPACNRWEPEPDCRECAACCRAAYDSVTVSRRDPVVKKHPELIVDRGEYVELARQGDRCAALAGGVVAMVGPRPPAGAPAPSLQPYACTIYADRPRPCRDFEPGGPHCLTARRRIGLSR